MAKLPIVTQQQQLSMQAPGIIKSVDFAQEGAKGAQALGGQMVQIADQWQQAQDYAEKMDAKNKTQEGYLSILDEAELYNDYKDSKELEAKKQEYIQKLEEFDSNVLNTFTSNRAAESFKMESSTATIATKSKINSIFRQKTINMGKSNLVKSGDNNRDNYIATGAEAFKQSFRQDLDGALQAGYITREHYQAQVDNMETWNIDKALNDASIDPVQAEENLKNGVYGKMTAGEKLDLQDQIQKIGTKKKKVEEFHKVKQTDVNEAQMLNFVQGQGTYDDKLREVNKKEFLGQISPKFASSARRYLTGIYEGTGLSETKDELMADIVLTSETLQAMGDDKSKEKLDEINKLRNKIMQLQADGKLTNKDAAAVNKKLNQSATITGQELEAIGDVGSKWSPFNYGYNNAYDEFKFQAGTAQGAKMFKEYYYQVEGKDYSDEKKREIVGTMLNNNMQTENAKAVQSIETFQSGKYKVRVK